MKLAPRPSDRDVPVPMVFIASDASVVDDSGTTHKASIRTMIKRRTINTSAGDEAKEEPEEENRLYLRRVTRGHLSLRLRDLPRGKFR